MYPPHGHLYLQIVPLVEHGEETEVTELNKLQYLNLLAQYRLAKCAKEEIDHFLKGGEIATKPTMCSPLSILHCQTILINISPCTFMWLLNMAIHPKMYQILYPQTTGLNEIVPDNLLSIFDENELEVSVRMMLPIHVVHSNTQAEEW